MSSAASSVLVFGVYLVGLGITLLTAPNLLLGAFGFPAHGVVVEMERKAAAAEP